MSAAPLSIVMVAGEFPYPPIHGGRADMWSRICALSERGVRIQLICWWSALWGGEPQPEHLKAVRAVVTELIVMPIPLGPAALLKRLMMLPRWPSFVAARAPSIRQRRELQARVQAFGADGVWQDNLWGGALAEQLSRALNLPLWVRAHNIEFRYMQGQRGLATSRPLRLRMWLSCLGLERYESRCLKSAQMVFDISVDDMAFWRSKGVMHNCWLPPIVNVPPRTGPATAADLADFPSGSALYVGNLHTPNNVQGLLWFFAQVWPRVLQQHPGATLVVAGSNPHLDVMAAARAPGVTLLANPAQVWPLYWQAAALINPVLMGSGVNIKTAEMLQTDAPVVCTSVGAGGLPPEVRQALCVADTPDEFATLLVAALRGHVRADPAVRAQARRSFQPSIIDDLIAQLVAMNPTRRPEA